MKVFVHGKELLEAAEETIDGIAEVRPLRSRANLARWLAGYARRRDCEVVVVFEPEPSGEVLPPVEHYGPVTVKNLQPGEEALRALGGPANRAVRGERTCLVTADPRLARVCAAGEVRVIQPGEFIRRARGVAGREEPESFEEPDEKYSEVPEEEVGFWLDFFDES